MSGGYGVSEVLGFSLILAMIILALGVWAMQASPLIGTDLERAMNEHILRQFAEFKYDLNTFMAAKVTGVHGMKIFFLVPASSHRTVFTVSRGISGRFSMERGVPVSYADKTLYYPVQFIYQLANRNAETIVLELRGGELTAYPSGLALPASAGGNRPHLSVTADSSFLFWVVS